MKRKAPTPTVHIEKRDPLVIISHNVNGFAGRIENNLEEFKTFLLQHDPDILLLQEAKLQCADGPRQHSVHNGVNRGKDNRAQKVKHDALLKLFPPPRFLQESKDPVFKNYDIKYSLSRDPKKKSYAGTICIYRRDIKIPMFRYWLDEQDEQHDEHGRIMILEFQDYVLMNTYAPNNQTTVEGWERRRQWDLKMKTYVTQQHNNKPLIWVGDLNTTSDDHDMDSPKYYRHDVYRASPKWTIPGEPGAGSGETPWLNCHGDMGQPGCTMNEQRRFADIRESGHLIDAYRHLHPVGAAAVEPGREAWTWRGSAGADGNPSSGRYWKRGMRIDYTLVHESLVNRIKRSEILGHGPTRIGFLGSDQ